MGEFPKDGSVSSSLCPFFYQGKVNIPLGPPCLAFAICGRRCMANWCVATLQSLGVLIDRAHFCAWTVYNEAECLHSLHDPVFKNFEQCHKSSNFWKTRNPSLHCICRGKYNVRIPACSFPARTFFLLFAFLVRDSSSVSFFSALLSKDCS